MKLDLAASLPQTISTIGIGLSRAELDALRSAAGRAVDETDAEHGMYRDLELRGYLRRIVSFDPRRYGPGDRSPKFSWTRTEPAESLLVRVESWGVAAQ